MNKHSVTTNRRQFNKKAFLGLMGSVAALMLGPDMESMKKYVRAAKNYADIHIEIMSDPAGASEHYMMAVDNAIKYYRRKRGLELFREAAKLNDPSYVKYLLKENGIENSVIEKYLAVLPYVNTVGFISAIFGFDDVEVLGQIFQESSGRSNIVSHKNAYGPMQVRKIAFQELWRFIHSKDGHYRKMRKKYPETLELIKEYCSRYVNGSFAGQWETVKNNTDANIWVGLAYRKLLEEKNNGRKDIAYAEYHAGDNTRAGKIYTERISEHTRDLYSVFDVIGLKENNLREKSRRDMKKVPQKVQKRQWTPQGRNGIVRFLPPKVPQGKKRTANLVNNEIYRR